MAPQPQTLPDLLEQAHLALLQGDWGQARSLLDRLTAAEPDNVPAQDLRATVIAKQAALSETARLHAEELADTAPQAQTSTAWTQPLPDSASALPASPSARQWPKPLLLVVYLLLGVLTVLLQRRHHHNHNSLGENITFGLVLGVVLFVWTLAKKR